jgi:histidyl-tRNA synthetase
MFRHERPQKGRYRQFDQIGAEALGFSGAEVDAELILMASALWDEIGLKDVSLEINSLGQPAERLAHRKALIAYLEQHIELLDEDARRRLHSNPLRVLDTKNPQMQVLVNAAPQLLDFLGEASLEHFNTLKQILQANGMTYTVNPRLVRGMDYYNLTVFEFTTNLLGSQGTVCAGGRYDYLFEQLGGKPTPAVGWALGVDRVLELAKASGLITTELQLDVYAIIAETEAMPLVLSTLHSLRILGVSAQMHSSANGCMGSMKSQFKRADASGARFALIFGSDEVKANQVTVKPLRDSSQAQITYSLTALTTWAATLQSPF